MGKPAPGYPAARAAAARTHAAGPAPGRAHAAGPAPGRHGAPAPGLRRGLAADIAAMLPRGRRRLLVILGALAIVAAGVLTGMALASRGGGSGSPSSGRGRIGGLLHHDGPRRVADSPAGGQHQILEPGRRRVDPGHAASAGHARGLGQTRQLLAQALKQGRFPGTWRSAGGASPSRAEPGGLAIHLATRHRKAAGGSGHRVPDRHPRWRSCLPDSGIGARRNVDRQPASVQAGAAHLPGRLVTLAAAPRGKAASAGRSSPGQYPT